MSRNTWFLLPLLALVACSSGSSDDAATATTATVAQATTPALATTAAPTTVAPATTETPATTEVPATTAAPTTVASVDQQVAFDTFGQEVTPITLPDDRGQAIVIYSSARGDFTGDLTSALVMAGSTNLALVWFEGTAGTCGDGGLAMRIGRRPDGDLGWEIVGGLGTGDLAHVTGSGVETAPNFVGTINCNGPAPAGEVSTTLLGEPVESNPVAENIQGTTGFPVVPNPAQTEPPRMEFAQVNYADSTLFTAQLAVVGYPATRGSGLLSNTWLALGVSDDCTQTAVFRGFIDNLLYEDFAGVNDVVEDATVCG